MTRKIHIFDTTLRDGEQSPGASMNTEEKLVVAQQLIRMGVDVIEAGFPISSPGDFRSGQDRHTVLSDRRTGAAFTSYPAPSRRLAAWPATPAPSAASPAPWIRTSTARPRP